MSDWKAMLAAEVERTSVTDVAAKIGYARTSVSLALSGKYVGSTERIAAAVVKTFTGKVDCPFLGNIITAHECQTHRSSPMPMSDPGRLRHWRACQGCAFNGRQRREEPEHV